MSRTKELEAQLEAATHRHYLYRRITRQMIRNAALGESLEAIVGWVSEFFDADSCLIYLKSDHDLVLVAAKDPKPGAIGNVRLEPSEGLTGWVAREKRLLSISREAYNDPRFKFFTSLPEDSFEAFLSAPIAAKGETLGVINIQHRTPHAHTGDQMEVLTTIGEMLGCLVLLSAEHDRDRLPADWAGFALRPVAA